MRGGRTDVLNKAKVASKIMKRFTYMHLSWLIILNWLTHVHVTRQLNRSVNNTSYQATIKTSPPSDQTTTKLSPVQLAYS